MAAFPGRISRCVFGVIGVCVFLSACQTTPPVSENDAASLAQYQKRQMSLAALDSWQLNGKLSIDDGSDGGSGRLSWSVQPDRSELDFRGALGRGAWNLKVTPHFALLSSADGRVTQAADVHELVAYEIGWEIPVDALQEWVLGLPASGPAEFLQLDQQGRVLSFSQFGWEVSFDRYKQFETRELPGRVDARQGERRVKLAIIKWSETVAGLSDG